MGLCCNLRHLGRSERESKRREEQKPWTHRLIVLKRYSTNKPYYVFVPFSVFQVAVEEARRAPVIEVGAS